MVSISCLDFMAYRRRGFFPCATLALVTVLPAFILCFLGYGAVCISLVPFLPWQRFSLLRSNHPEVSFHRIFDTVSLTLHCLKHFNLKCWFAAGSKGSDMLWISKIWDMNPFPWGCTPFSGLHQNLYELGLEPFWQLLLSSDSQYWSGKWKRNEIDI